MQNIILITPQTRKKHFNNSCLVFLFLSMSLPTLLPAQGLLIFPKRATFEGRQRVQTFNLNNIGKDTARYEISYVQMRMTENGDFQKISQPDSAQFFADPYLRFFPRHVILAPQESQVVKVQLTKTNELVAGREYRSHLYFRAVPIGKPLGEKENKKDTTSISVHLSAVYGISIANIIRTGESTTKVSISNLSLETFDNTIPLIKMEFHRTGNRSCYGDIIVNYISSGGKTTEVGKIQGFAVYTPGNERKVKMQLQYPEGKSFKGGRFHVVYTQNKSKEVIAEAELKL